MKTKQTLTDQFVERENKINARRMKDHHMKPAFPSIEEQQKHWSSDNKTPKDPNDSTQTGNAHMETKQTRRTGKTPLHGRPLDDNGSIEFKTASGYDPTNPRNRPHHTYECLAKGEASACPICKPINDAQALKLTLTPRKLAEGVYRLDSKLETPNERSQTSNDLTWGAFDESGNLRAILESESEAYFYVRNRGHMHNGSYRRI